MDEECERRLILGSDNTGAPLAICPGSGPHAWVREVWTVDDAVQAQVDHDAGAPE